MVAFVLSIILFFLPQRASTTIGAHVRRKAARNQVREKRADGLCSQQEERYEKAVDLFERSKKSETDEYLHYRDMGNAVRSPTTERVLCVGAEEHGGVPQQSATLWL